MDFKEYQKKSRKTAKYSQESRFAYLPLGLAGEAGEVAEKFKKIIRDKDGKIDDDTKKEISKELGDVLWYVAQLSTELGLEMDDVAKNNIEKLYSRLERGVIQGDGDNR
ncbi:MAG: nucleoside triphosphate pyrophosphohydrolase family protein [Candidatus Moranbacteria bacterium]|nr:nucleoside triphosphate pyrophosphohydrolase family protein [Candidatus Moranbacteria bacterium]